MPDASPTTNPVRLAAERLELLSPATREQILERMDPAIAQQVRDYLTSLPDNRPHGSFSNDVATRRELINQMANGAHQRRSEGAEDELRSLAVASPEAPATPAITTFAGSAPGAPAQPARPAVAPTDPLDRLRALHPAAIARAMQGERAEAWAIVLDRLDANPRAALQLYLDGSARLAIEDARARQAELEATSPALLETIVSAIATTVVPRAMREHQQLLSTTPLAWTGEAV